MKFKIKKKLGSFFKKTDKKITNCKGLQIKINKYHQLKFHLIKLGAVESKNVHFVEELGKYG